MKQRISVEQLSELSDEQKERLREWWKPVSGDSYYYEKIKSTGNVPWGYRNWEIDDLKKHTYPLLSIGQMIEFMAENKGRNSLFMKKICAHITEPNDDICDSLWEVCKYVLKEIKPLG